MLYESKLLVKKLSESAHLPTTNHKLDAGVDLYTCGDALLRPVSVTKLRTGIAVFVPEGMYGSIEERGSVASLPPISIGAGVVDEGYSGEIVLVVKNPTNKAIFLAHHTSIAQIVFKPYVSITEVKEVEELPVKRSLRGDTGGVNRV